MHIVDGCTQVERMYMSQSNSKITMLSILSKLLRKRSKELPQAVCEKFGHQRATKTRLLEHNNYTECTTYCVRCKKELLWDYYDENGLWQC